MNILIVEDDFISRKYLQELMKYAGHVCYTARNATEGFDIYDKYSPEVILCDILIPGISGLSFLEKIRCRDTSTAIIMLASGYSEQLAIKALRLGADDYLHKPVQDSELLPVIEKVAPVRPKIALDKPTGDISAGKLIFNFKTQAGAPTLIVERLMNELGDLFDDGEKVNIEIGLLELVTNAIEHGNLGITYDEKTEALLNDSLDELYAKRLADKSLSSKSVCVTYDFSESECSWTIKDEGNGFLRSSIPDPTEGDLENKLSGRGIYISGFLFDKVEYLGKGNVCKATKKRILENSFKLSE